MIGIFTSRAMRERGRYQIQLMKTRSSSGVGQKIDLEFDVDSLRIRDLGEDEDTDSATHSSGSILANIKRGMGTTSNDDVISTDPADGSGIGKIRAQTDSTKLRQFLNNLDDE
jgi:hypothetical protein